MRGRLEQCCRGRRAGAGRWCRLLLTHKQSLDGVLALAHPLAQQRARPLHTYMHAHMARCTQAIVPRTRTHARPSNGGGGGNDTSVWHSISVVEIDSAAAQPAEGCSLPCEKLSTSGGGRPRRVGAVPPP